MDECIKSTLSKELLVANGEITKQLVGRLSFVPMIAINGVSTRHYSIISSIRARSIANHVLNVNRVFRLSQDYSREIQSKALNNFFKLICDTLTDGAKPSRCGTA
jgi:hypothetical protein